MSPPDLDTAASQGLEPHELEALARAHAPALYRFSLSVTRDPELAEDLVQETFVRALERGGQYRGEAAPVSWLRRILFDLAIDRSRRHGREVPVEEVEESWRDDAYTVDSQAEGRAGGDPRGARGRVDPPSVHLSGRARPP